ncbi:hypothetical protein Vretimale_10304 [Volvox reticuliferus]|uniref:SCP domain-containing protein n=2 Tax=Volvox reticuliferus TaxID=1737510 RepID=A0A8J4GF99_9CHLO|nr:hypothetical protein Vretimale_10304 [Volvox reticuliferus]
MSRQSLSSRPWLAAWALLFLIQLSTIHVSKSFALSTETTGDNLRGVNGRRLVSSLAQADTADSVAADGATVYPNGDISRRQLATLCITVSGYVSFPDSDHVGDTIGTSKKPAQQCTNDPTCVAYNSAGELKRSISPLAYAPGSCIYIKKAFAPTKCDRYPGYLAKADVDHTNDNINIKAFAIKKTIDRCNSDPACKGFNSNGWLKSVVTPTVAAKGVCLYTKTTSQSSPPPPSPPPSSPPSRSPPPPSPPSRSPPSRSPPPPTPPPPSPPPPSSTSPSPSSASAGCYDAAAALAEHNKDRALHGCPALTWNDTLAKASQAWAETLAAALCGLRHSSASNYGENLYAMLSNWPLVASDMLCTPAVKGWYSEVKSYVFSATPYTDNQANFAKIGHFTQVVWKSTTQVGCGAALGDDNYCLVVVCRYTPPGNINSNDYYLRNVPPLK